MGRFICLHISCNNRRKIWIKVDAITAVIDARPIHDWTCIDTYAGAEGYCVEETAESVIGMIEQKTDSFDIYEEN